MSFSGLEANPNQCLGPQGLSWLLPAATVLHRVALHWAACLTITLEALSLAFLAGSHPVLGVDSKQCEVGVGGISLAE